MDSPEGLTPEHRDLLLELSLLIGERRGVDEIYASFADHIRGGVTFDFTSLFVVTADSNFVRSVGQYPSMYEPTSAGTIHPSSAMGADRLADAADGSEYIPKLVELAATQEMARSGLERAWVTPLLVDGTNYGMLTVAKEARGKFPDPHLVFLRSAARLLAKAVRQDLDLERARLNAARAQAASDLIFALQAHEPFDSIFDRLPALLKGGLDVDYVGLVIDKGEGFQVSAETPARTFTGSDPKPEGDAYIKQLAESGDTIQFRPSGEWAESLVGAGYKRGILAFLRDDETLRGILILARTSSRKFDADECRFIELLKSILSQSLANQHRLSRTEAEAARADTLNEVALLINAGENIEAIFQRLLGLLESALDIEFVELLERGFEPGTFRLVGSRPEIWPAGFGLSLEDLRIPTPLASSGDIQEYDPTVAAPDDEFNRALATAGMHHAAAVILRQDGEMQGVLGIARRNSHPLGEDEKAFLGTLSAMLAQAIANQHRLKRTQAAVARASTLNEVAVLLNAGEDIEAIFQKLIGFLQAALQVDYVGLLEETEQSGVLRVVGSSPVWDWPAGRLVSHEEIGIGAMLQSGLQLMHFRPENLQPGIRLGEVFREVGMARAATLTLWRDNSFQGVLTIARNEDRRLDSDEGTFLGTLAVMLAQAIANQRQLAAARKEAERNKLLNELAVLLHNGEPPEVFFESLSRQFRKVVPTDGLTLLVRQSGRGNYRVVSSLRGQSFEPGQLVHESEFGERVLAEMAAGAAFVQDSTETLGGSGSERVRSQGIVLGAVAPIRYGEETLGFFLLGRGTESPFTEEDRSFVELVSALVGQALANRQKVEASQAEAIRSQVLSELAVLLQGDSDIGSRFERLAELLLQAVGFDFISVTTRDPVTGEYRSVRSHELVDATGKRLLFEADGISLLRSNGRDIMQYRTANLDRAVPRALHEAGFLRGATAVIRGPEGDQGMFTIGRRDETRFSDAEMAFIELVSALLGQAAQNFQKAEAREAEALRNRILSELGLLLSNGEPIDTHFQHLRELLLQGVGFDFCSVAVRGADSEQLRSLRSEPLPGDESEAGPLRMEAIRTVLATGSNSVQYGEEGIARGARAGMFKIGVTRAASFVLTAGPEPEGLLTIGRRAPKPFTPAEMAFFEVVAALLAHAAANERRLAMTEAEAADQAILADAASAVSRETTAVQITRGLRTAVSRFIPSPFVSFGYLAEDGLRFANNDGGLVKLPIGPNFRDALASGQTTVISGIAPSVTDEAADEVIRIGLRSHVLTVALSRGVPVGLLVLGSREGGFTPSPREERLCRLIAGIMGPAMANALAVEREREEAVDQAILAEAGAAVAREREANAIVASLESAISRFVPETFVRFGFFERGEIAFRTLDGKRDVQPIGTYYREALDSGQSVVPPLEERSVAGDVVTRTRRARLQSHMLTRADSAGMVVGFLLVGSRDATFAPGPRETKLCRQLAEIVGPAMANARAAEREREEAVDQAIIAEAASAVASEIGALDIVLSLKNAVGRFIAQPFVNFGYLDGDSCLFPTKEGGWRRIIYGERFKQAIERGQSVIPGENEREQWTNEPRRVGLQSHVATRVSSGGSPVGILVVGSRDPAFKPAEREQRLCSLIADIVGPAMANWRALQSEREEAEDQAIIGEAAAAAARETTSLAIIRSLRAAVARFIPAPFVNFGYLEGENIRFPSRTESLGLMRIDEHFEKALIEGELIVPSTSLRVAQGETKLGAMLELGIEAHVLARASTAGETTGLLVVGSRDATFEPGTREVRLCRLIADIVGPAMANARAMERQREEAEEQRLIAEVAAAAAREAEPSALVAALQAPIRGIVAKSFLAFGYIEEDQLTFPMPDGSMLRFPMDDPTRQTSERGQIVWSELPSALMEVEAVRQFGVKIICSTAIVSGGAPVGILLIGSRVEDYTFSERVLRIIRLIAQIVGPAMENARTTMRARLDAEEQRFLAAAAAAVASAESEVGLASALRASFEQIIPDVLVSLSMREPGSDLVSGPDGVFPLGPQAGLAFETGQSEGRIEDANISARSRVLMDKSSLKRWVYTATSAGGERSGLLWVATANEAFEFSDRDRRLSA